MERAMAADLREELLKISTSYLSDAERAGKYRRIAWEAVERLEAMKYKAPPVCVDAVKWQQKPLDCQGVKLGEVGKIDIQECEIEPAGSVDIREYFARG
jgi:predicted GNAT family acetyltransferase